MEHISEILADAFRQLLLDTARGGAWDFARDRPAVPMCADMEEAMRFAVRAEREPDVRPRVVGL